ncbi:MAG: XRE family transcriptional regulator [Oxalobacter sp.]|nr:MAG: XRE family transcriptional regulator [Oxalobacter sp.]
MLTHKQMRAKALGNAEVKAEYEKLSDEYALLDEFLKARTAKGLTQAQVAQKIGTTQSAVARMESGSGKHSPSLATLSKYAEALGCKLEIKLVRKTRSARNLTDRSSSRTSRAAEL